MSNRNSDTGGLSDYPARPEDPADAVEPSDREIGEDILANNLVRLGEISLWEATEHTRYEDMSYEEAMWCVLIKLAPGCGTPRVAVYVAELVYKCNRELYDDTKERLTAAAVEYAARESRSGRNPSE